MNYKKSLLLFSTLFVTSFTLGEENQKPAVLQEIAVERQRLSEHIRLLEEQMAEAREQAMRLDSLENRLMATKQMKGDKDSISEGGLNAPERVEASPEQRRDNHQLLTSSELVADDFVGSWPLFGSNYRMKIGGYFKLDALYDVDGSGDKYQFLISQIPVEGTPGYGRSGYFNMFVRETRLNLDVRYSEIGEISKQFFLEMDFFDTSSTSPRLRHAYINFGNLLIGQTWSTIVEMSSVPRTIDFAAGDALFGTRTPQIRWSQQIAPDWSWAVGLEAIEYSGIYNPLELAGSPSPQLPLLAGRLTHERKNGVRSLAALVQQLRWDGETVVPDATAVGWAVIFAGRQNLDASNFLTWNMAYGDGTPETIMALTGSEANAVLTANNGLITRKGYAVALSLGHTWSKTLSSNLAYAWTDLESLNLDIEQRAPDAIQGGGIGQINLIWTPTRNFSTGLEYMWGIRENVDGADGSAQRIQTMVKHTF
jgi:hypothetical protein